MFSRIALTERRCEVATGLVILLILVGGFLGGEVTLRAMNLVKFGVAETVEKSEKYWIDPLSGLRTPKPGTSHGGIMINTLGYRSPEIAVAKPPGVFRLAFLGSSTTFDAQGGFGGQKSWPHLTWRLLQEALPECRLDYVNAGVPGFGLEQVERYLDRNVARIETDLLVVMTSDMDGDLTDMAVEQGLPTKVESDWDWLADRSVFFAKLLKNYQVARIERAATRTSGRLVYDADAAAKRFEDRLVAFVARARAHAKDVVLITPGSRLDERDSPEALARIAGNDLYFMPFLGLEGLLEGQRAYAEAIVRAAERSGAILSRASERVPKDDVHYADTSHFSLAGGKVMAVALSRDLLGSESFRRLLPCSEPHGDP